MMVVMGGGVHGLSSGDMGWGDIRAGGRGGLVEVWWCRETVTTVGFWGFHSLIVSGSCHRESANSHTALLSSARALGLGVRSSGATGGRWGTACAAALPAFLQTTNDIRGGGDDLGGKQTLCL